MRIREELSTIGFYDRVMYCKADFRTAIGHLRLQRFMGPTDLSFEITSLMTDFFDQVRIFQK